jgi:hypothetical protein
MKQLELISKSFFFLELLQHYLFIDRLIGHGTVPLNDVIRTGTIKRRVVQLSNPQGILLEAVSIK